MSRFRYVILDGLFPRIGHGECDQHKWLAAGSLGQPTSAGFAQLSVEDGRIAVSCWGESVGLKLKAAPGDGLPHCAAFLTEYEVKWRDIIAPCPAASLAAAPFMLTVAILALLIFVALSRRNR